MGKYQKVWVLGDEITSGMRIKIDKAKRRRQKIHYFNSAFQEVPEWEN